MIGNADGFAPVSVSNSSSYTGDVPTVTLDDVMARLNLLRVEVEAMKDALTGILATVQTVQTQVDPVVKSLQNSPIFKMLGGA